MKTDKPGMGHALMPLKTERCYACGRYRMRGGMVELDGNWLCIKCYIADCGEAESEMP